MLPVLRLLLPLLLHAHLCLGYTNNFPEVDNAFAATSFEFGAKNFRLKLNAGTLDLQNITVSSADGAFTQGFIMDTVPSGRAAHTLWQLNVTDCKSALPEGTRVAACIASDCANVSHTISADGSTLSLRWDGVPLPPPFTARLDVVVTVAQLPGGRSGVSLRGAVGLSAKNAGGFPRSREPAEQVDDVDVCLQTFALPTLERILLRSEATDAMFMPDFFGHVGECAGQCEMEMQKYWDGMVDHTTGVKEYEFMPNGNSRSMQWFAFYSNATSKRLGLYVAAHDPDSRLQIAMASGSWASTTGASLHWYQIPSDLLTPLTVAGWKTDYEVVLQGFEGDWFDASQIYREWVLRNARWTRKGNLSTRLNNRQFPHYLTTVPFLVESVLTRPAGGTYLKPAPANDTIATMVELMALLNVSEMITWWSSWNSEMYDTKYPQVTPRKGFAERVEQMRNAGIHVVPYTNGRLFDSSIAAWNATNASSHMCYSTAARPFRETWHTTGPAANISFYLADPADRYWADTFVAIAKEMQQAGVDGLYIDQVASYFPQPCFSRLGGDAAGSGWAEGGRRLLAAAAEALGPDTAVFSESNAEAYIGDLHGNMALYGWQTCGFVPAFQAVYGAWTMNAGMLEWPVPNKNDPTLRSWYPAGTGSGLVSWMAYSALHLVYGHIPGGMQNADLIFVLQHSPEALALWRDIMRVRATARDFLVFGQMLRPPAVSVPIKTVQMCGNKPLKYFPCCPVSVVAASIFKAENGSVVLIAANIANETIDYVASADVGSGRHVSVSVSLPPASARAVLLRV